MPHIVLADLAYAHPDGTPALSGITASLTGKVGLVGRNGSGKTTLLRLLADELRPTGGTVRRAGDFLHLPQNLTLRLSDSLADLMGISAKLAAFRAIQSGSTSPGDYDTLGDDWDIEERALGMLHALGLAGNLDARDGILERRVGDLSGGEAMAAALAGAFVRRSPILLLDEPTNNLDARARRWLHGAVERWGGCIIAASHDGEFLKRMDAIAELRRGGISLYGCSFSRYLDLMAAERETAERRVAEAGARLKGEKRRLAAGQARAARSTKQGVRAGAKSRFPTAAIHQRRSDAEKSASRQRVAREERIAAADAALREAKDVARPEDHIVVDLPETEVPAGKTVLELEAGGRTIVVRGPERIVLEGGNGSGKTTLLRALLGRTAVPGIEVRRVLPEIGCLPQRLADFDDGASAIDTLLRYAPGLGVNQAHAVLARFLLRNERARQAVGTLSGGERLRLALACLLSATPVPRLILLDEPTNNLDRQSVAELTEAVNRFRGAVIAVSHDGEFLRSIGATRTWTMEGMRLSEK